MSSSGPSLWLAVLLVSPSLLAAQNETITSNCLGCICEAASNCDRTLSCQSNVCGLFRITNAYWIDANQPTVGGESPASPGAYERCTKDPACAAEAVKNYLYRFAADCNFDGVINCKDFVLIHILGGYGCRSPLGQVYWDRFNTCIQSVGE